MLGGWGGVDSGCHPRSFRTQRAPVGVGVGGEGKIETQGETQKKGRRGASEERQKGESRKSNTKCPEPGGGRVSGETQQVGGGEGKTKG